jgi:hypothetical protein
LSYFKKNTKNTPDAEKGGMVFEFLEEVFRAW